MGKWALALCTAANLAVRHETPVALFTLEMSKSEVTQRLMCSEAKVESQRLRSGRLAQDDWPRLTAACDKLMKAPIYVDDTGSITMMELRSKARRLNAREPKLGMIIVDYLQLMTSGSNPKNRVQEVSQISRQLKVLARDLEVPILALSQLSRAVEQRHDKRPILSDLRESGSIERTPTSSTSYATSTTTARVRLAGARRGDSREAPQRPDRRDQAQLPQAVREVHRHGRHDVTSGVISRRAAATEKTHAAGRADALGRLDAAAEGVAAPRAGRLEPRVNHACRCSDEPCVQDSGVTRPVARSWIRSSPTAAAASRASATSRRVMSSTKPVSSAWPTQSPA